MLKRKVKQFVSLLTTLALTGSFALGAMAPASAAEKIKLGESGYVSLHSYTSTTDVENVHKVTFTLDVNTLLKPKDIVFVVDNSGSMGLPEDKSAELASWVASVTGTTPSLADYANMGGATATSDLATVLGWDDPTKFISNTELFYPSSFGAWKFGEQFEKDVYSTDPSVAASYRLPASLGGSDFRFEWMKDGLKEAIDLLVGPTNGSASLNRVAVFAYGSGDTDNTSVAPSNLLMQPSSAPSLFDWEPYGVWGTQYAYNWGTGASDAGPVWANDYHKWLADVLFAGGSQVGTYPYNEGDPFEWGDALTFNSNTVKGGTIATVNNSSWVNSTNYTDLTGTGKAIDTQLVRREEGTTMAAGLSAAYELLNKYSDDDHEKYVFVLTDGEETSARTDTANRTGSASSRSPEYDQSESLAIATNLKNMKVQMYGLGILEQDNSVFKNDKVFDASLFDATRSATFDSSFVGSYASTASATFATDQPNTLQDYVVAFPSMRGISGMIVDPYLGESHMLRVLAPLKDNAPSMAKTFSPYDKSWVQANNGSTFLSGGATADFPIKAGTAYKGFVDEIEQYGDFSKIHYYRANDSAGVKRAFREFAKSLFAASSITPDITLGNAFSIYQMPGKSLFEFTGGSTATGGNRSINWSIPNIAATGGSVGLSFYVKVDPANADPNNMWQGLLEHFMIDYVDFNEDLASKGLPQNYVLPTGTPDTEVKEIDHRLDDSKYPVSLTRKTETPAFIASLSSKGDIAVSDVKAQAIGKGKAKLTVESPDRDKLYFQWQYLDTETGEWISIKGANASIFTVTGLKAGDYTFRCAIRTATSVFSFTKEVKVTVK